MGLPGIVIRYLDFSQRIYIANEENESDVQVLASIYRATEPKLELKDKSSTITEIVLIVRAGQRITVSGENIVKLAWPDCEMA